MQEKSERKLDYENLVQEAERIYRHAPQEAFNLLKQATDVEPKSPKAWLVKGKILEHFLRCDEALACRDINRRSPLRVRSAHTFTS